MTQQLPKMTQLNRLLSRIVDEDEHNPHAMPHHSHLNKGSNSTSKHASNGFDQLKQTIESQVQEKFRRGSHVSHPKRSSIQIDIEDEEEIQHSQEQQQKVHKLINSTMHRMGTLKLSPEQAFYNKNMKRFEALDTFISSKQYMTTASQIISEKKVHKRPRQIHERVSVYSEHLQLQEQLENMRSKQEPIRKIKRHSERNEAFFDEYRSMFWEANNDNEKTLLDNEAMNTYNDFKYLVYLEKFFDATKEQQEAAHDEQQIKIINTEADRQKLIEIKQHLLKSISKEYSPKLDEADIRKLEEHAKRMEKLYQNDAAKEFKIYSDKVLSLIRSTAKKIFNKKDKDIQRQQAIAQIEKNKRIGVRNKIRENVKEMQSRLSPLATQYKVESSLPIIAKEKYISSGNSHSLLYRNEHSHRATESRNVANSHHLLIVNEQPSGVRAQSINIKTFEKNMDTESKHQSLHQTKTQVDQEKLQDLIGSLSRLQKTSVKQQRSLKRLSKERLIYVKSLDKISKPGSIKDTLVELFEKKNYNYDMNFYKKIKNSFKKQMI